MILIKVLSWYIVLTMAGWLMFPLAYRLLAFLPDRGLSLSRSIGLLVWGYAFWLLVSLGILQNDAGGGLFALLCAAGLSFAVARKDGWREAFQWVKQNARLVAVTELIFIFAFSVLLLVRAAVPDASGTEKPMELAFINSILRSPSFPPNDPWLSGYAISYYYFGYVMVALLAKMVSISGAVAFNLAVASWFALSAMAAYGILHNLLVLRGEGKHKYGLLSGLLAPLFVLIAGNLEGLLEMLHARGIFWNQGDGGTWQSSFWSWLGIQELTNPPTLPLSWTPERMGGIWWWRASRVLQDFALDGSPREVIDEFPMFSYLLGDLHPHVLAMPFALLAIGLAMNIFLERRSTSASDLSLFRWIRTPGFWITSLVLGGLSFLNTWDFPIYLGLFSAAAVLFSFLSTGWRRELVLEFLIVIASLGLVGIVLYLPFYLSFDSQANGILPSLIFFTRGIHLWIMFGLFLLVMAAWMAWTWGKRSIIASLAQGILFASMLVAGLWLASILMGWFQIKSDPSLVGIWGAIGWQELIESSIVRRFESPGAWLTLLALVALAFGLIHSIRSKQDPTVSERDPKDLKVHVSDMYVLLLVLVGSGLVVFPEFFYLRDQFGFRMNTIFKFYFQGWILWALAAGYASAVLLRELRGFWRMCFTAGWIVLVLMSLPYPIYGILSRTNLLRPGEWTLDGASYIGRYSPEEMEAIRWLQQAPYGVLVEAVGGSYTGYARISTHTGLPSVLGWPGHESQWRGGAQEMGSRETDIARLFRAKNWDQANEVLQKYQILYVYVGPLEIRDFRPNQALFEQNMPVVFRNSAVTIYEYQVSDTN